MNAALSQPLKMQHAMTMVRNELVLNYKTSFSLFGVREAI